MSYIHNILCKFMELIWNDWVKVYCKVRKSENQKQGMYHLGKRTEESHK